MQQEGIQHRKIKDYIQKEKSSNWIKPTQLLYKILKHKS